MKQAEHREALRMDRHHARARGGDNCVQETGGFRKKSSKITSSGPAHASGPEVLSILCISQLDQEGIESQRKFIQKLNKLLVTGKCHFKMQIFFARIWLLRDSTDCHITDLLNSIVRAFQQFINGLIRD